MDHARARGIPIAVIQHTNLLKDAVTFRKGSPEWELHPEVASRPRRFDRKEHARELHRHRTGKLAPKQGRRHRGHRRLHGAPMLRHDVPASGPPGLLRRVLGRCHRHDPAQNRLGRALGPKSSIATSSSSKQPGSARYCALPTGSSKPSASSTKQPDTGDHHRNLQHRPVRLTMVNLLIARRSVIAP